MRSRLLVLGAICFAALILSGQSAPTTSDNLPPGFVDGSKTPDLIPDRVALRLVLLSFTVSDSPTPLEMKKQDSSLRRIGLSDADKSLLRQQLTAFAAAHARWNDKLVAARLGGGSPGLNDEGWGIVEDTRQALDRHLSSEGRARLAAFITQAKAHMVARP